MAIFDAAAGDRASAAGEMARVTAAATDMPAVSRDIARRIIEFTPFSDAAG
ncbi:MAG: hypothetical protein ACR2JC_20905 [Chloroflexota bacterium]